MITKEQFLNLQAHSPIWYLDWQNWNDNRRGLCMIRTLAKYAQFVEKTLINIDGEKETENEIEFVDDGQMRVVRKPLDKVWVEEEEAEAYVQSQSDKLWLITTKGVIQ